MKTDTEQAPLQWPVKTGNGTILIDARLVTEAATIHSETKLTPRQLWEQFEHVKKVNAHLREQINQLADHLAESHQEEIDNNHFGDGPEGCSYCKDIARARAIGQ